MSDRGRTENPLFEVSNHHTSNCGNPPHFNGDDQDAYTGYFANTHGEQAFFRYVYESNRATLRMGDAGWDNEYMVVNGTVADLILNRPERLWLIACWEAATGQEVIHDSLKAKEGA